MYLLRLTNNDHPLFDAAYQLYTDAFPYEERRDTDEQLRVLQKEDYHFDLLMDQDRLLGIVLYWQTGDMIYLEHLATIEQIRGKGTGTAALGLLKEKGKTIILEIEPPSDDLTRRRLGFYQRNGFILTPHDHIQLKYHLGDEDLTLKILSYPHGIQAEEYSAFRTYLDQEVGLGK